MSTTEASCVLTAQPWNTTQYALDVVHADGHTETLLEQTYAHLDPTTWTFPAGDIVEVHWAKHVTTGVFYDVMQVTADCRFTTAYHATPGKPDSVVIAPAAITAPPTTTSTTPVAELPPIDTSASTPLPPADLPPASWTDETLTPAPSTTVVVEEPPAPTPPAPGSSTTLLEQTFTTLPVTGGEPADLVTPAALMIVAGLLAVGAARRRAGVRWGQS